jgi:hypothetical protein
LSGEGKAMGSDDIKVLEREEGKAMGSEDSKAL